MRVTVSFPTSVKYDGWRVLHKLEGGYPDNPPGMPEVIPPDPVVAVPMTQPVQAMSYDLMRMFNAAITPELWTKVHNYDRAFTNFNGFGDSNDPRANYILMENLAKPLPKYDKAQRLCGGQFVRGDVVGDRLVMTPGIHGIDAAAYLPNVFSIVEKNWYLFAVTLYADNTVGHFPQGQGGPVAIPFILKYIVSYPLKYFERWQADVLPDPLLIYK